MSLGAHSIHKIIQIADKNSLGDRLIYLTLNIMFAVI